MAHISSKEDRQLLARWRRQNKDRMTRQVARAVDGLGQDVRCKGYYALEWAQWFCKKDLVSLLLDAQSACATSLRQT